MDVETKDPFFVFKSGVLQVFAGWWALGIGGLVLLGWALHFELLASLNPQWVTMKVNTALSFVFLGASLLLLRKNPKSGMADLFALLAVVLGLSAILAYFFHWGSGLDEFFVRDDWATSDRAYPGRMAPITALSFVLLGLALFASKSNRPGILLAGQSALFLTGLLSLLAVIGYLYGVKTLYQISAFTTMAFHTAATFLVLSAGALALRPSQGLGPVFLSEGTGTRTARGLLPVAILVPLFLGWLRIQGEHWGWFDADLGTSLLVVLFILIMGIAIGLQSALLNRESAALSEKTNLLNSVLQSMSEGIVVADPNGKMTFFNAAAGRITGVGMSSQAPDKWTEEYGVFNEDRVTPCPAKDIPLVRALQGEEVQGMVQFLRNPAHPGGVAVKVNGRPLRDEQGNISGGLVVVRDITLEMEAEEKRKKAEEKFALAFEGSPNGMIMTDEKGAVLLANAEALKLFGYSKAELIGQSVEMLVPERFRVGHARHRSEFKGKPAVRRIGNGRELFGLRKDGSEFPVEIGLNPIRTEEGLLVLSVMIDITERKKIEAVTRLGEAQAIENLKDYAILMLDPLGKILTWNAGAEKIKGYKASEIIGLHFSVFYTPEDRDRNHPGEILKTAEKEGRMEEEGWRVRKDGSRFMAHVLVNTLRDEQGKLKGFIKITRDISELKRNEEMRIYTRALEASNKEMQDFIFVVSHDLQEPLRKIQSFGNFLEDEAGSSLNESARNYLTRMKDAGRRMSQLIEDLLQLTRVTTRAKPFEEVELSQIIEEVTADLELRLQETGGKVLAKDLPRIEVDPSQMRQLFQNLINNALKFRKRDLDPLIEVTGAVDEKANRCLIRVKDNGIGFDQKYADKIFNIFQRLNGPEYEGTGIGLAICRKVVERHRGSMKASSKPGEGAVFEVILPVRQDMKGEKE